MSHACRHGRGRIPALRVAALLVLVSCALLAGCAADNRITLRYLPTGLEGGCGGTVAVASFLDAREDKMLGRNESFDFRPQGRDVAQWVRDALMQELAARGCAVSPDGANGGAAGAVVGGSVRRARLMVTGMDHVLDLEIALTLTRGGETIFKKTYSGRFERKVLMASREVSEEMFASGLQDLLTSAVPDLAQRL